MRLAWHVRKLQGYSRTPAREVHGHFIPKGKPHNGLLKLVRTWGKLSGRGLQFASLGYAFLGFVLFLSHRLIQTCTSPDSDVFERNKDLCFLFLTDLYPDGKGMMKES